MNQEERNKIYDFVFIGLGASNSLILISLIQNNTSLNNHAAILPYSRSSRALALFLARFGLIPNVKKNLLSSNSL